MDLIGKFAILCCSLLLFTACTKTEPDSNDNNKNNNLSTVGQLLVAGKWQVIARTATTQHNGKDTTADLYAEMDDCEKDDFVEFVADGKVVRDENANKCSGNPQNSTFTWKLMDNNTKIAIYDSNPDTLGLEISSTQMKFTQTKLNSSGVPINYLEVYKNIK